MSKRRSQLNPTLQHAAEGIGWTFGQIAGRLDNLHQQREAITAEIHHLAQKGSELLTRIRSGVGLEAEAGRKLVKREAGKVYKLSATARKKMSIAAKKRHAAKRSALPSGGGMPTPFKTKGKRTMSAEARRKISIAMKKRHAERKAEKASR